MKLRIVLGTLAVGVLVLFAGCVGGVLWVALGDGPLVTYGAAPATVEEEGLDATGYREINSTDVYVNQSLAPLILIPRDVSLRTWITVYAKGIPANGSDGGGGDTAGGAPGGSTPGDGAAGTPGGGPTDRSAGNVTLDPSEVSVATAFSMSAMKLGPVEANPVVHATSPGLLGRSGFVVDYLEGWIPGNLTDLTVENSEPVRMLGKGTRITTFSGTVTGGEGVPAVDVTLYLARVTHEGDLVILVGVYPASSTGTEAEFRTLVEHVVHGR